MFDISMILTIICPVILALAYWIEYPRLKKQETETAAERIERMSEEAW